MPLWWLLYRQLKMAWNQTALQGSCLYGWTLLPSQNTVAAPQTISAQLCLGLVWKKWGWQHKTVLKLSCIWTQVFLCFSHLWKEMGSFREEASLTATTWISTAQFLLLRYYICLENTGVIWEKTLVAFRKPLHLETPEARWPWFCLCLKLIWKASWVEKLSQRARFES